MNMHVSSIKDQYRWFGNTLVAIRNPSSEGLDGISIIEHWMPSGEAPPLHIHQKEDEIFHIFEGELRFAVGGEEIMGRAGETLLAPKGVPHAFRVESASGAHCLTITRGSDFESMLLAASRPASHRGLPAAAAPTAEMIETLVRLCAANRIDIVGPPLG